MMRWKRIILSSILLTSFGFAQVYENLSEEDLQRLEQLAEKKLDLNSATQKELGELPFLSVSDIAAILTARKEKPFLYPEELIERNVLDREVYGNAERFFKVSTAPQDLKELKKKDRKPFDFFDFSALVKTAIPLEKKSDYAEKNYAGKNFSFYQKYNFDLLDRVGLGLVLEKDVGEKSPADVLKWNFEVSNLPILESLVIGANRITWGEGLLVNTTGYPLSSGLSSLFSVRPSRDKLVGDNSSNENMMFGGGGTLLFPLAQGRSMELSAFADRFNYNETIIEDEEGRYVSGLSSAQDPYHRTETEIARRNSVYEALYGGRWKFQGNMFKLGCNFLRSEFSETVYPEFKDDKFYRFRGEKLFGWSVDGAVFINQKNELFFEIADTIYPKLTETGSFVVDDEERAYRPGLPAAVAGYEMSGKKHRLLTMIRFRPFDYYVFHGEVLSEKEDRSEFGVYLANQIKLNKRLTLGTLFDGYFLPYRGSSNPFSENGFDLSGELKIKLTKILSMAVIQKFSGSPGFRSTDYLYNYYEVFTEDLNFLERKSETQAILYLVNDVMSLTWGLKYAYYRNKDINGTLLPKNRHKFMSEFRLRGQFARKIVRLYYGVAIYAMEYGLSWTFYQSDLPFNSSLVSGYQNGCDQYFMITTGYKNYFRFYAKYSIKKYFAKDTGMNQDLKIGLEAKL